MPSSSSKLQYRATKVLLNFTEVLAFCTSDLKGSTLLGKLTKCLVGFRKSSCQTLASCSLEGDRKLQLRGGLYFYPDRVQQYSLKNE